MCVCVCLSENRVYPVPLPVIEHNYWTWIKLSLIYLLTKKVIFRGYLGHIRQPTVVIHPPVWTAPSNSLNQFTQILLMADVDNLSPKDQKKCGSNESPVWPGSFPILLMVIFHVYPHVQTNPLIWWVSPIWTNDTPPKNGKPRLKRQGSPKRCGTCSFQLVQEYVPHNSQVSNLSMVGGCYVPMSQVSAPKNGWLSRLSSFVEVSWVRNFHPDRPCLYLGFQKPSKTGLQKKTLQYVQAHWTWTCPHVRVISLQTCLTLWSCHSNSVIPIEHPPGHAAFTTSPKEREREALDLKAGRSGFFKQRGFRFVVYWYSPNQWIVLLYVTIVADVYIYICICTAL